ncbi:MAG: hypothetical protein O3A87_05640 [Verrucomicrobia bacterium]|nr:hypothetical protein [Verrucomicrobiota bacterium]MDA1005950.1 hypothetical protein [Verrucomicrobiota bacterium]
MPTSFQDSRDKLLQHFLDFLWRQWTALGVPGHEVPSGDWIIDPEALVLITTRMGRYDSRLLDNAIEWLSANGRRINLQRLKRLRPQWPTADPGVFGAISEILSEQSALRKWNTLRDTHYLLPEEPEPLFIHPDGSPLPVLGDLDERFQKYGLLRTKWTPRGTAQTPLPNEACNLILALRSLFGVNARAEILAWLLTHESGHPGAIARDTAYFPKTIQLTLNEMEESGCLHSIRQGREKRFRIQKEGWQHVLSGMNALRFPRSINWSPVYYFISRTLDLLKDDGDPASSHLRAIQQRGFLDEVGPALDRSGLQSEFAAHKKLTGDQLTQAIEKDVSTVINLLQTDFVSSAPPQSLPTFML